MEFALGPAATTEPWTWGWRAFPGVWLGSRWSVRMPEVALRPTLLVLVGASGLRMVGAL